MFIPECCWSCEVIWNCSINVATDSQCPDWGFSVISGWRRCGTELQPAYKGCGASTRKKSMLSKLRTLMMTGNNISWACTRCQTLFYVLTYFLHHYSALIRPGNRDTEVRGMSQDCPTCRWGGSLAPTPEVESPQYHLIQCFSKTPARESHERPVKQIRASHP